MAAQVHRLRFTVRMRTCRVAISGKSREIGRLVRARGGHLVALLVVASCIPAASRTPSVSEARSVFSREQYCRADRVVATRELTLGTPPAAVARDPERFAMWKAIETRRKISDERQIVRVDGCGEHAKYSCWDFKGEVPGRRHRYEVTIGASCIDDQSSPR